MEENGNKFDEGKPPLSLLDRAALIEVARVMAFGEKKYGRYNWRGGIRLSRLLDAALRHIYAFLDGENGDFETGLSPLAHAMCDLMMAFRMYRDRPDMDDRYREKPKRDPKIAAMIMGPSLIYQSLFDEPDSRHPGEDDPTAADGFIDKHPGIKPAPTPPRKPAEVDSFWPGTHGITLRAEAGRLEGIDG